MVWPSANGACSCRGGMAAVERRRWARCSGRSRGAARGGAARAALNTLRAAARRCARTVRSGNCTRHVARRRCCRGRVGSVDRRRPRRKHRPCRTVRHRRAVWAPPRRSRRVVVATCASAQRLVAHVVVSAGTESPASARLMPAGQVGATFRIRMRPRRKPTGDLRGGAYFRRRTRATSARRRRRSTVDSDTSSAGSGCSSVRTLHRLSTRIGDRGVALWAHAFHVELGVESAGVRGRSDHYYGIV